MTATQCHQCRRPNSAAAKSCLWCGAPLSEGAAVGAFDTVNLDVDYVEGIDRLNEPCSVRLLVSQLGIEVMEVLPGTRAFKIPSRSIHEAALTLSAAHEEPTDGQWWRSAFAQVRSAVRRPTKNGEDPNDYIITIKYTDGDEVRTAVFSRSERHGPMPSRRLAGILEKLTDREERP